MPHSIEKFDEPIKDMYLVSRTSSHTDARPCAEAYRVKTLDVDKRTTDDPKKVAAYGNASNWWYCIGTNHRVERGQICRDLGWSVKWAVQIDNLLEFVKKHGNCVVGSCGNFITLEIYDDYRE